jgi:catechol 2,3-dioxygenase-like lactoylglutathione lyase family enzyme
MQVERVDHVHVEVRDREQAAAWYARVLGLTPHRDLAVWADHTKGPLILAGGDGHPALALFAREPAPPSRDSTVAFRVRGAAFRAFLDALDGLNLTDRHGRAVTRAQVVDHDLAWSIYFVDPDGNPIEVTSYDRDGVG